MMNFEKSFICKVITTQLSNLEVWWRDLQEKGELKTRSERQLNDMGIRREDINSLYSKREERP